MNRFLQDAGLGTVAILCAVSVTFVLGQPPATVPAPKTTNEEPMTGEPTRGRPPGGMFGELGAYLTIEGVRLDDVFTGGSTLNVDTVSGKKLAKPVAIWINNLLLPKNTRCVFKGYESGTMIGQPPAMFAAAREQGRELGAVQAAWQWRPHFVALIAVEPKGLKIPESRD